MTSQSLIQSGILSVWSYVAEFLVSRLDTPVSKHQSHPGRLHKALRSLIVTKLQQNTQKTTCSLHTPQRFWAPITKKQQQPLPKHLLFKRELRIFRSINFLQWINFSLPRREKLSLLSFLPWHGDIFGQEFSGFTQLSLLDQLTGSLPLANLLEIQDAQACLGGLVLGFNHRHSCEAAP